MTLRRTHRPERPEFVSIPVAAGLLGISESAAYAEASTAGTVANGRIPVVQLTQGSERRRGRLGVSRTRIAELADRKAS
jgi:hypothetical protein